MQEVYSAKEVITPENFPPGTVAHSSGNGLSPKSCLDELANNPNIRDITLSGALFTGPEPSDICNLFSPQATDRIKHHVLFAGPHARVAINEGRAQYVVSHLSQLPHNMNLWGLDTVIIKTSEPVDGQYSFGLATGALPEMINYVKLNGGKIIVASDPNVPYIPGATISEEKIDFLIHTNEALPKMDFNDKTDEVRAMARMILSQYIHSGQTLQLGIGIPAAVAELIGQEKIGDLNIFTEVLCGPHRNLIDQGLVTNAGLDYSWILDDKTREQAIKNKPSIAAFFFENGAEDYERLDQNHTILAQSVAVTNNHFVIQSQPDMVSINGAAMIDLYGNVNVTHILKNGQPYFMAGIGGHRDYCVNAKTGIVAMVSRTVTKSGLVIPRIVPFIPTGIPASVNIFDKRIYVTEQGIVNLANVTTLEEAAVAIYHLAHPEDRKPLYEALLQMPGISKSYVQRNCRDGAVPKGFTPRNLILGN